MRILRFPSLSEPQFFGCVSAFLHTLTGELNAASVALTRLRGKTKGSAFADEMTLDCHRYGALIVLDRWGTLVRTFGPHLHHSITANGPSRVEAAETILVRVNRLIDAAEAYTDGLAEACIAAFQSLHTTFAEERAETDRTATAGFMPAEYREARHIFLEDLAAR